MKKILATLSLALFCIALMAQKVCIVTSQQASNREQYAAEYLQKKLTGMGYIVAKKADTKITLHNAGNGPAEGYKIGRAHV